MITVNKYTKDVKPTIYNNDRDIPVGTWFCHADDFQNNCVDMLIYKASYNLFIVFISGIKHLAVEGLDEGDYKYAKIEVKDISVTWDKV